MGDPRPSGRMITTESRPHHKGAQHEWRSRQGQRTHQAGRGDLTDNDDLKNEGKKDEAAGKVKDAADGVKDKFNDVVDKVKDSTKMSNDHQHSVDVNVPVRVAYNQWTQFEEFPNFHGGVEEIRQITDDKLHWKVDISRCQPVSSTP